jgi:Amt family ammonium transporter
VFGGTGFSVQHDIASQLGVQALGVLATLCWSGGVTYVLLKVLDATVGLRVSDETEVEGLDLGSHGERGYSP